jgi:hypothetical protein
MTPETIKIDDAEYIRKDLIPAQPAETFEDMPYMLVRTYSAGVFAGYLESRNGQEGVLRKARRIWYWEGAATLSQLAMDGTSEPQQCKFPCEVDTVILTQIIELIPTTKKAQESIKGVPIWVWKE